MLKAFPVVTDEYAQQAIKITSAFTGDPSFFAFNGEDPDEQVDEEDPDVPPTERFREIHRLAHTVYVSHNFTIYFRLI